MAPAVQVLWAAPPGLWSWQYWPAWKAGVRGGAWTVGKAVRVNLPG